MTASILHHREQVLCTVNAGGQRPTEDPDRIWMTGIAEQVAR